MNESFVPGGGLHFTENATRHVIDATVASQKGNHSFITLGVPKVVSCGRRLRNRHQERLVIEQVEEISPG